MPGFDTYITLSDKLHSFFKEFIACSFILSRNIVTITLICSNPMKTLDINDKRAIKDIENGSGLCGPVGSMSSLSSKVG